MGTEVLSHTNILYLLVGFSLSLCVFMVCFMLFVVKKRRQRRDSCSIRMDSVMSGRQGLDDSQNRYRNQAVMFKQRKVLRQTSWPGLPRVDYCEQITEQMITIPRETLQNSFEREDMYNRSCQNVKNSKHHPRSSLSYSEDSEVTSESESEQSSVQTVVDMMAGFNSGNANVKVPKNVAELLHWQSQSPNLVEKYFDKKFLEDGQIATDVTSDLESFSASSRQKDLHAEATQDADCLSVISLQTEL